MAPLTTPMFAGRLLGYKELDDLSRHFGEIPIGPNNTDTITIGDLQKSTQATLVSLFSAWKHLRRIVAHHETVLNKRWLKKSMAQRKAILLSAWPGMPENHRPNFELLRMSKFSYIDSPSVGAAGDRAARFPYVNLEDLSKLDRIPRMISSRCRELPSTFANADRNSIEFGLKAKIFGPEYIFGYNVDLCGDEGSYGHIIDWRKDPEGFFKNQLGLQPDAGMGLMVLEIQRDVLQFLVRYSTIVLHDFCLDDLEDTPLKDSSQASLGIGDPTTEVTSLTIHALEAPYNVPDAYDFGRLQSFIEAKHCEAQDHLLLLKEDPGYFAETMVEYISGTGEYVLLHRHNLRQTFSRVGYNTAIAQLLNEAYDGLFFWDEVSRILGELQAQYIKYAAEIRPGQTLPEGYFRIFIRLAYLADTLGDFYSDMMFQNLSCAPAFAKRFLSKPPAGGIFDYTGPLLTLYRLPQADDRLWWLLNQIQDHDKVIWGVQHICGLSDLLEEVEHLTTKDPTQNARLTPRLTKLLSNLSVVAEVQRQLDLSTCNGRHCHGQPLEDIHSWFTSAFKSRYEHKGVLESDSSELGLAHLVMDLKIYDHPSDKKRTAATTAKMRSAESALDCFWEQVNQAFISKIGKDLRYFEEGKLPHRDLQRTPIWEEPRPKEAPKAEPSPTANASTSYGFADLEARTDSTIGRFQPKPVRGKIKSRGVASIESTHEEAPTPAIEVLNLKENDSPPRMLVRKKAQSTFFAMFGKPVEGNKLPGEIPWADFRKAMVNIGFSAEKLQGSAWLFKKPEVSGWRSIIFHEPHPESKLPMKWARRIARRLQRIFGWTADSFVTAEEEPE